MTQWTTRILAEYVRDTAAGTPDAAVARAAANVLIDLIGCAAAGYPSPAARAARIPCGASTPRDRRRCGSPATNAAPRGPPWPTAPPPAPWIWTTATGRPAAIPAPPSFRRCWRWPRLQDANGRDVIAALRAGYEVAVRVAGARDFSRLDTLSTGRWCAYGVVAAAGLLVRDTPQVLATAFAIAGVLSPGLSAAGYSTLMGNQVKEGIPWAVMTGLTALELARQGLTGPLDILDHPDYFDAAAITAGLGTGSALTAVYFKPYACCRWIHAAIDAIIELVAAALSTRAASGPWTCTPSSGHCGSTTPPIPTRSKAPSTACPSVWRWPLAGARRPCCRYPPTGSTGRRSRRWLARVHLHVDPTTGRPLSGRSRRQGLPGNSRRTSWNRPSGIPWEIRTIPWTGYG